MRADALPPEVERELAAIDAALAGRAVDPDLQDLALLAQDLRDERPPIDPSFARDLDARAQAGFPRSARPGRFARLRRLRMAPTFAPAAFASLLVALLVAVPLLSDRGADQEGGGAGAGSTVMSDEQPADEASRGARPPAASGEASAEPSLAPSVVPPRPGGGRFDRRRTRKVEVSAALTLTARPGQLDRVADGIVRATDRLGGFVVSSSVSTADQGGSGTFELRVPSGRLQRVLAELSRLAHVSDRQQATQDITAEHASARERLENARAERKSLLRRLERAGTDVEAQALRGRLADVGHRIRQAKADAARVNNRAAFSTVAVALSADPDAAAAGDDGRWGPGDAARDALRVLEVAAGAILVGAAVLLPLTLLALLAALTMRATTRRRRERALDAT